MASPGRGWRDVSTVRSGDSTGNREADPRSARAAQLSWHAVEPLEHQLNIFSGQAHSGVGHDDLAPTAVNVAGGDRDFATGGVASNALPSRLVSTRATVGEVGLA